MATAPIGPLAWEPPYATGAVQAMAKRQKKKKKKDSAIVASDLSRNTEIGIPIVAQWVKSPD